MVIVTGRSEDRGGGEAEKSGKRPIQWVMPRLHAQLRDFAKTNRSGEEAQKPSALKSALYPAPGAVGRTVRGTAPRSRVYASRSAWTRVPPRKVGGDEMYGNS